MKGCWRKWAAAPVLALLLVSNAPGGTAAAASLTALESQLHSVHVNLVADKAQQAKLQAEVNQSQVLLGQVDQQLTTTRQNIAATQAAILVTENRIGTVSRRLARTRAASEKQQGGLDAVLLYTQQYGPIGYLAVLLHVASFGEFVTRLGNVIEVAAFERSIVLNLNHDADLIHHDLVLQDQAKAKYARQQATLVRQRDQQAQVANQRRQVLATLQSQQQQINSVVADEQQQGQKLWDAIQQLKAELADGQLSSSQIFSIVKSISAIYGIDPLLVMAVIREESGGNTHAVSSAGAQGLMQLMPSTAAELGVTDAFNAEQNVHGGIAYLSYLLKLFNNNIPFALAAYNAGPNAVKQYGGIPPYPETQNYVKNIMYMYQHGI
jgi:soluble lytic murein transglycosylase